MATYSQIAETSRASDFRDKLMVAIAKAAQDVLNEPANTPNHMQRVKIATVALYQSPGLLVDRFVWGVLQNPVIADAGVEALDSDIQFVVNSIWDSVASTY